jgi:transposase
MFGQRRRLKQPLLTDEIWAAVRPLLPPEVNRPEGGRPRVPDRVVLAGILFVLRNGIAWEALPRDLGHCSGMTCWRRLREWQVAGIWPRIRRVLLDRLPDADQIDWSRPSHNQAGSPISRSHGRRGERVHRRAS